MCEIFIKLFYKGNDTPFLYMAVQADLTSDFVYLKCYLVYVCLVFFLVLL